MEASPHGAAIELVLKTQQRIIREADTEDWWHDTKERRKSNLIIFITPTIVQDSDFQPTQTDFLHTPPKDKADVEEAAWLGWRLALW